MFILGWRIHKHQRQVLATIFCEANILLSQPALKSYSHNMLQIISFEPEYAVKYKSYNNIKTGKHFKAQIFQMWLPDVQFK